MRYFVKVFAHAYLGTCRSEPDEDKHTVAMAQGVTSGILSGSPFYYEILGALFLFYRNVKQKIVWISSRWLCFEQLKRILRIRRV